MRSKYAIAVFFVLSSIIACGAYWQIFQINQSAQNSIHIFFKRALLDKMMDVKTDGLEMKEFGYELYRIYCPSEVSSTKVAIGFSANRFVLIQFDLETPIILKTTQTLMEGSYERGPFGIHLISGTGDRSLYLPFKLLKEKDFYTTFLSYYGEKLHPRYCAQLSNDLYARIKNLEVLYNEDGEDALLKRPAKWQRGIN
jgi:hypothetical protein